jgi:hypothetical protein
LQTSLAASDFLELREILSENVAFEDAVLKAGKVGGQFRAGLGGQRIYPPRAANFDFHHPMTPEVGKLLGRPHRTNPKHLLKVANTLRLNAQQIENAQAFHVAQALVDRDDLLRITWFGKHLWL